MHRHASARRMSLPMAFGLVLIVAAQGIAASWSLPAKVFSRPHARAFLSGLVTPSSSTAVALYETCGDNTPCYSLEVRRTADGGMTWAPAILLSEDGFFSSIGGRGDKVDVAWVSDDGAVKYARSSDGGQSFANPKTIASVNHSGGATSVARGPNGLVAIAWVQNSWTGKTRARVSTDGGYSFGAAQTIATGTEYVGVRVAVGNGTVYVASVKGPALSIRRSTDGGASWTTPQVMSGDTTADFSITVEGSDAYVAYPSDGLRYRHTSDNGAHWSSELQLLKPNLDLDSFWPRLSLQGGVLRAVFNSNNGFFYRESSDGITWSSRELVSEIGYEGYVGFAGRPLVVYSADTGVDQTEVRSRYRTP